MPGWEGAMPGMSWVEWPQVALQVRGDRTVLEWGAALGGLWGCLCLPSPHPCQSCSTLPVPRLTLG